MPDLIDDIRLSEETAITADEIEAELLRSLRDGWPQAENANIILAARDGEGRMIGGLVAGTSYGWLLVKSLWVGETFRGRSIGRALLNLGEEKAKSLGCHAAWLDTSSPDARRFYGKHGYEVFSELANGEDQQPPRHRRWFMKKALSI